ncbi:MAG: tRNA (5-methylaminomethyl-2-thiouridine)(34)-methyltransferase MnmD [Flavobacteriia bacterium]
MIQNKEIFTTADGSKTFYLPELNEYYHSHHGAIQEAKHVFLKNGLFERSNQAEISIFEVGFGTGLNAFLTAIEAEKLKLQISYTGIEAFPLTSIEASEMTYTNNPDLELCDDLFTTIHATEWNKEIEITANFELTKINQKLQDIVLEKGQFDIIYFDAFGPRVQDELWQLEIFQKLFDSLKPNGLFVTYCAKGQVKRDLKAVGFVVETLAGPPGKREMVRGRKLIS